MIISGKVLNMIHQGVFSHHLFTVVIVTKFPKISRYHCCNVLALLVGSPAKARLVGWWQGLLCCSARPSQLELPPSQLLSHCLCVNCATVLYCVWPPTIQPLNARCKLEVSSAHKNFSNNDIFPNHTKTTWFLYQWD